MMSEWSEEIAHCLPCGQGTDLFFFLQLMGKNQNFHYLGIVRGKYTQ